MDSVCRFCGKKDLFLKPIFDVECDGDDEFSDDEWNESGPNESVPTMISNCCGIEVSPSDDLPLFFCNKCLDKLLASKKLRWQAIYSINSFRNEVHDANVEDLQNTLTAINLDVETPPTKGIEMEPEIKPDQSKMCRFCQTVKLKDLIPITEDVIIMNPFNGIPTNIDNSLPNWICLNCMDQFEQANEFRGQCITTLLDLLDKCSSEENEQSFSDTTFFEMNQMEFEEANNKFNQSSRFDSLF